MTQAMEIEQAVALEFVSDALPSFPNRAVAAFPGGTARIFENDGRWQAAISWTSDHATISLNSGIDVRSFQNAADAIQWCREMIETGPEVAVDAWFRKFALTAGSGVDSAQGAQWQSNSVVYPSRDGRMRVPTAGTGDPSIREMIGLHPEN
jgi:hypothetical protein